MFHSFCLECDSYPNSAVIITDHNYAALSNATMRIKKKPGEIMEVDWAGQTALIKDQCY
jgi:hypothetical protein